MLMACDVFLRALVAIFTQGIWFWHLAEQNFEETLFWQAGWAPGAKSGGFQQVQGCLGAPESLGMALATKHLFGLLGDAEQANPPGAA